MAGVARAAATAAAHAAAADDGAEAVAGVARAGTGAGVGRGVARGIDSCRSLVSMLASGFFALWALHALIMILLHTSVRPTSTSVWRVVRRRATNALYCGPHCEHPPWLHPL